MEKTQLLELEMEQRMEQKPEEIKPEEFRAFYNGKLEFRAFNAEGELITEETR